MEGFSNVLARVQSEEVHESATLRVPGAEVVHKIRLPAVVQLLADCSDLRNEIQLTCVPHFTTLQKASIRLLRWPKVNRLLEASIRAMPGRKWTVKTAAIDSSGFESHHCSQYFVKRRSRAPSIWQTTTDQSGNRIAPQEKDAQLKAGFSRGFASREV